MEREGVNETGVEPRWMGIPIREVMELYARATRESQAVKIRYFRETDTLYIEFRAASVTETRDLDEDTQIDVDAQGNICAITVEHASRRAHLPALDYKQVAA